MKKTFEIIGIILTVLAAACAIAGAVYYFFSVKEKRLCAQFSKAEALTAAEEE